MSTTPDPIDRTGRPFDLIHADYYHGVALELFEGDGVRLLPHPSNPVPAAMAGPLVVTAIDEIVEGLFLVEFVARATMVSNVVDTELYGLPAATTPEPLARVMSADERVLIRG
jgi:hypothetical protein